MADAINPHKYGVTPDGIEYVTVLPDTARSRVRTGTPKLYVKFPWLWLEVLSKPRVSSATFLVAAVLLYEAWKLVSRRQKPDVKLTSALLNKVGVEERGKRTALAALERLKLVSVERRWKKNPIVTVHFL